MLPVASRDRCWFLRMKCTLESSLEFQINRSLCIVLGFSVSRTQAGTSWVGDQSYLFKSIKVPLVKNMGMSAWTENTLLELLPKLCSATSVFPFLLA